MVDYPVSHTDRYLDDLCIGEVSTGGPIKISEAEIVALGKPADVIQQVPESASNPNTMF
jgi:hypothetical protein